MEIFTSRDLKPVPALAKGKTVEYRLLGIRKDKDGFLRGPSQFVLPSEDVIIVPRSELAEVGKKDNPDEEVEVALEYFLKQPRMEKDDRGNTRLIGQKGDIIFQFGSLLVDSTDIAMYNYLERSNFNRDNPFRLANKHQALFYRVDPEGELKAKHKKRGLLKQALNLAEDMPEEEMNMYAKSLGIHDTDPEIVRAKMSDRAETDPEAFIKGSKSPERKYKAIIQDAIKHQLLEYAPTTNEWNRITRSADGKNGRVQITRVPVSEDPDNYFVRFLITDETGLVQLLEDLLKDKVRRR